ncbi:unnamed protein product [Clonostachys chloroleuca]|uniref:Uncharacterized protein n=1 Tax=Clonostachys chloroleuca TaxID=1926264 RepID=A0AA35VIZ8_9HYPO|nr:unnamed protein product [Clonostachys chloroleuca]
MVASDIQPVDNFDKIAKANTVFEEDDELKQNVQVDWSELEEKKAKWKNLLINVDGRRVRP